MNRESLCHCISLSRATIPLVSPSGSFAIQRPMFSGKDTKYLESKWNELPEEVQEAAKTLGFTSDTWDEQSNDIYKRKWKKLSTDQKEAAEILGWDEDCRCEEQ